MMYNQQQRLTTIGTIPYIGFYRYDLTYFDDANQNTITIENKNSSSSTPPKKLINFEKHRKEYEILSPIKLFQQAADAYSVLIPKLRFKTWFDNVRTYTETECWDLSYQIEPKETIDNIQSQEYSPLIYPSQTMKSRFMQRTPSTLSLESQTPSNSESLGLMITSATSLHSSSSIASLDKISTTSNNSLRHQSGDLNQRLKVKKTSQPHHSRSSSGSSFLTSSNGSSSQGYVSATASPQMGGNASTSNSTDNDTIIAKVHLDGRDGLLYKKIRIRNDARTNNVLKTILDKFGLDPSNFENYCIEQRLPDRKIIIPDRCNVFYAVVRSSNDEQVYLVVREKTRQERQTKKQ